MGRRKRGNSFEIAKGIAALLFLGALLLVGGDYRKLPELLPLLFEWLLAVVSLILFGILAFYFIRGRRRSVVQSQATVPIPVKIAPVMDPASSPIETPKLFTEDLIKKLEWRRFEQLV